MEFAFILPIVLLLVIGVIEFGKAFNYWLNLNDVATEGARWAAVDLVPGYPGQPATGEPAPADLQGYILSRINSGELRRYVEGTDGGNSNIEICFEPAPGSPDVDVPHAGDAAKVSVSATYPFGFLGGVVGSKVLTGTSWTRLEQTPTPDSGWEPC